jgi:PPM family protein phosphatase
MKIGRTAVVTDTGRRRLGNEDAFIREPPLFAIADGMGGARAGEVAAGLARGALVEAGAETGGASGLGEVIVEANRRIWERSLADPETEGMGTTVTVALVDEASGSVAIGHVGDSRAYRWRDGDLEQLTTDHSLVAELVESGILTPEEAERHPQRSAITRALGTDPAVEVDTFTLEGAPGDLFLLCSDGLSDMLADDEVAEVIAAADADPNRSAEALVLAANERGGEDNVTVVLFELVADDEPVPAEPEASVPAPDIEETHAESEAPEGKVRRHGAGPGGRLTALLLLLAVLAIAALVLYWGISK